MANRQKLLQKARNSPSNLRFTEICKLAEGYGWERRGGRGSHFVYTHPELGGQSGYMMNFQEGDAGKAKESQVKQLIDAIELHGLDEDDE